MCLKKKIVLSLCCLLFLFSVAMGKNVKLNYIGQNPLKNGVPLIDTIPYINILKNFDWNITVHTLSGKTLRYATSAPDTLKFNEPFTAVLTTSFEVNPQLVNQIISLFYTYNGSVKFKLNGADIIQTGAFCTDPNGVCKLKQDDFCYFTFKDTSERIEVTYASYPGQNFLKLNLTFHTHENAEQFRHTRDRDIYESYALSFYYLAFAIIFIIFFFFFRERTENLYFSLFCLCAAFTFVWDKFKFDALEDLGVFMMVFSLEFLSIFFAKIIKNKERSKLPLLLILLITIVSYYPPVYNYCILISGKQFPIIRVSTIILLLFSTGLSSLYYLVQGIGQKRWEARAIVTIISIAILLFFVIPLIVVIIINSNHPESLGSFQSFLHYALNMGLCIYPLSAAIVLGKRNGMDQARLLNQVNSIEQLSAENLEKEKEKQMLLENQNTELEQKVAERTYEVQKQKELIELKNKAITDNINYAQRIQSAILPDIKLIYKALEHSFILFLPKDIVSGDFYAFAEKNGRVLIIAGDCTGHGVSGAFMSMIGSALLNQIINEKGVSDPAQILNLLNSSVIESLKQSENESNDGMDISICSFDLKANTLQFAGANRPLWLVRDNTLEVFKPDKFPIGGLQAARNRTFTNYEIALKKNDAIYIFTDGYADQFGGEKGKKLMTAKFKEMLLSMQSTGMRDQEKILKDNFETWKGDNEQVDDVLVIGVSV
jgi:serine phosphatase RsbU (regulator of sigma subunit)